MGLETNRGANQFSIPTLIRVGMLGLLDAWLGVRPLVIVVTTEHYSGLIILSMTSNRLNTSNMITSNNFNLIRRLVIWTPVWVLTFGVTTQLAARQQRDSA